MVSSWTCGEETISYSSGPKAIPYSSNNTLGFNWTSLFSVSSSNSDCPVTQIAYRTSPTSNYTIVAAGQNITSISTSSPAKFSPLEVIFFTPATLKVVNFTAAVCGHETLVPKTSEDAEILFQVENTTK